MILSRLRDERAIFFLLASKALLVFITVVIFIYDVHFGDVCATKSNARTRTTSAAFDQPPIEGTVTTTDDENCGEEKEGRRRDGIGGGIDQSAVDPVRGRFKTRTWIRAPLFCAPSITIDSRIEA